MYDVLTQSDPQPFSAIDSPCTTESNRGPSASAGVLARMLDIVDYGLLLVLDDGHVAFANQVARSELDEGHLLQLRGQKLRVKRPQDVVPLRAAITGACMKGLQKLLTLSADGGSETITISVVPMSDAGAGACSGAMLVFGKRSACEDLSTEAFARYHKLTAAEVRVLKQLCVGRRPSEIARAQGVALSTVRTQIGCAREKTGATSIGALIRQVSELPPMQSVFRSAACRTAPPC